MIPLLKYTRFTITILFLQCAKTGCIEAGAEAANRIPRTQSTQSQKFCLTHQRIAPRAPKMKREGVLGHRRGKRNRKAEICKRVISILKRWLQVWGFCLGNDVVVAVACFLLKAGGGGWQPEWYFKIRFRKRQEIIASLHSLQTWMARAVLSESRKNKIRKRERWWLLSFRVCLDFMVYCADININQSKPWWTINNKK